MPARNPPAEYAIDPLGTGRRLGLTNIAAPRSAPVAVPIPEGAPMVPTLKGPRYWENPGGTPIKIHLTSAGFYTSAIEIHSNRTRYPHVLHPLVAAPANGQSAPAAPIGR